MQPTHLLVGGALLAALGWLAAAGTGDAAPPLLPPPPPPPAADGHYSLVVEGDRDHLAITHARAKAEPWAGVPKGLQSDWRLQIRAADRSLLAEVPLDLAAFDLAPARKGGAVEVDGCIVRDPRVAMLANVPRFAAAAEYTFVRRQGDAEVWLGTTAGAAVRELAGGGR
ncbi:MAG: hypothetical protein KF830_03625 [Planctomycetes bacterium]|nr:hypothetical protein [Planctomycetota bacterium]